MNDTVSDGTMKTLGRDARDTVTRAVEATDDMTQRVGAAAGEAGAAVREAAHKVSAAAGDMGERAIARGNRYGKDVLEQVEQQPMTSLLVVAAASFIAGLLLARR